MQVRKIFLFAALLVAPAWGFAGEDANGSCEHTAAMDAPAAPAYSTPDFTAQAGDEAEDAQTTTRVTAWNDYLTSLAEALSRSAEPRDWALAALTHEFDSILPHAERSANDKTLLIQRAVAAAPNDLLVQWIAEMDSRQRDHADASPALTALQHLEPENAAVWLDVLSVAARHKDASGVDRALAKMSASTRFDLHSIDLLRALVDAYGRYPLPADYEASARAQGMSREATSLTTAFAVAMAAIFPAFNHVLDACRIDPASGTNQTRAADCAATGRLMIAHGDSLIANRIGAAILRVSHAANDEDFRTVREQDWIYQQHVADIHTSEDPKSAAEALAFFNGYLESENELEAMRRAVVRSGGSLTPPADWVDERSPLFGERVEKADQAALDRLAR
jgi:hypothetical protein